MENIREINTSITNRANQFQYYSVEISIFDLFNLPMERCSFGNKFWTQNTSLKCHSSVNIRNLGMTLICGKRPRSMGGKIDSQTRLLVA